AALRATGAGFEPWYRFFPWEDWREKRPDVLDKVILPLLEDWARRPAKPAPTRALGRRERGRLCFALGGSPWGEEKERDRHRLISRRRAWPGTGPARAATPRWRGNPCPGWATPCPSITAASSPPRSRGCAPSSNTVPSYSS